jgi:hypothetical protein
MWFYLNSWAAGVEQGIDRIWKSSGLSGKSTVHKMLDDTRWDHWLHWEVSVLKNEIVKKTGK